MRRGWGRRIGAAVGKSLVSALIIVPAGLWAALALWFRLPAPQGFRALAAALFVVVGLATIVALFSRRGLSALIVFALAFGGLLVWWGGIKPPAEGDWAPDVARQTTGVLNGDILTLSEVRDFDWRSDSDFTERWSKRTYDLAKLRTLDLFLSYWSGPRIAHLILSFGFEGGEYLAWSVEVRRERGGVYSPVADAFKTNSVVFIAATERDIVRLRTNIRHEDVRLYRLATPPADARVLLLEYVEEANALAVRPMFYNSITTNCTTAVAKLVRAAGGTLPLDWRLIVNGYLPSYLHDLGALDANYSLVDLKALASIDKRAREADDSPDFSRLIRVGVPSPRGQRGQ
jgi:hypothetical protein